METVYLSHHFSENTYLVAGKCALCYRDDRDVRIVGANGVFLDKYRVNRGKPLEKLGFSGGKFFVYLDEKRPDIGRKWVENPKERGEFVDEENNNRRDQPNKIKFVPPRSPYNLIEEQLYDDPWRLLVATIFLNKTSLRFSKDHLEWFLHSFKGPYEVLRTDVSTLEKYFEPLGLQRTRSVQVYYMTHDYLFKKWQKVEEIFGIGEYGRDAYNMFCLGNFDVEPKDRYLRIYKNWYQKVYLRDEAEFEEKFYRATSQKDNCEEME